MVGADTSPADSQSSFGINDAVLDWKIIRGAERPFSSLSSISDVLCFFSLIEAVAIYDKLWVAAADAKYITALKPLVDRGVIAGSPLVPDKLSDPSAKNQFKSVASILRHGKMARLSEVGALDEAAEPTYARYMFAEGSHIDSVLDPVLTSYIPLIKRDNNRAISARLSRLLSDQYKEAVQSLATQATPIRFYIPPAPAVILDRSSGNLSKLVDEVLAMRDEFSEFRKRYSGYQQILADPTRYSLSEMADTNREAFYEVETAIKKLKMPRTGSRLLYDEFDLDFDIPDSGVSLSVGLGALAKGIYMAVRSKIVRGRAQCLFDLWKSAISIRGYDKMLQKHFDLEEDALTQDVDLMKDLGVWIDEQVATKTQNDVGS